MKIRRHVLFVTLLLAAVFTAASQQNAPEPVRWRTLIKTTGANTGTVTFKALVAQGWHLYGFSMPEGGPKATTIELTGCRGMKFTGEITPSRQPVQEKDPLFGMTLSWWDTNVDFTVPFIVTDPSAAHLDVKITFMACDGTSCRPPKTETVAVPVKLKPITK